MCGCLSHAPHQGPGPQPRHVPDWELNRQPFGSQAPLNPLSHTSRGSPLVLSLPLKLDVGILSRDISPSL